MSALPRLRGHLQVRATLARAATSRELPGSLLIHGPAGVGKQRLALWLGQYLLCKTPADAEPCGHCQPCRLVLGLQHPDLYWFFPLPRPKSAGSPEKLADALEEARAASLAERRADPYRPAAPGDPVGIFLAQMQTLRRYAANRPAIGARRIFLIGDAELLVPQEASPEAANALLKVLEEPPTDTTFMLTASDPQQLLPTLRSRLLPIRLRPLPDDDVAQFLIEERGLAPDEARSRARLAQGSIGRALAFLPADGEPGPLEALRTHARALLEAALADQPAQRLTAAHAQPPAGARGAFSDMLELLALWLRDLAAAANGGGEALLNADDKRFLVNAARRYPALATTLPDAIRAVEEARGLARSNINPQLILASLLRRLGSLARTGVGPERLPPPLTS